VDFSEFVMAGIGVGFDGNTVLGAGSPSGGLRKQRPTPPNLKTAASGQI
jgi:hypothetical protein